MGASTTHYDAIVIGGGPAGLAAAVALARKGVRACLAAAPHRPGGHDRDRRTAALFSGSIEFLRNLNAWDALAAVSAPLVGIRLIDDTGGLMRAPEITFRACEAGLDAFGYNVPNDALADVLSTVASQTAGLDVRFTEAASIAELGPKAVLVTLSDAVRLEAPLIVAADGRASRVREAAKIAATTWSYPQTAVVTWFAHGRDHGGISSEFHRPSGPFTTVPMPGRASSLVWVETPHEAQRLMTLADEAFREAIERRLQGLLGSVGDLGPRAAFPLSGLKPATFAQNRVALVGEAAHVIPPIGAQGLNLGLRDAACLADCAGEAKARGEDPGGAAVLQRYSAWRAPDIRQRITAVDILNRSLITPLLPVQLLRGLGLHLIRIAGPLRQRLVREGVAPSGACPSLMQPSTRPGMAT
jgi:2-octaprenyl-6-methoxyphenol hydroxylase